MHNHTVHQYIPTPDILHLLTYHSIAIEGSRLSLSAVKQLMNAQPTLVSSYDELMAIDHFHALNTALHQATSKPDITPAFIRTICAQVMQHTGGIVNTIMGTCNTQNGDLRLGTVHAGNYTCPHHQKVPALMDQLCRHVSQEMRRVKTVRERLELAFYLHFHIVSIHPFGDGNGRTARLLMNYVCQHFGLPPAIVFQENTAAYFQALQASRQQQDITLFYAFMHQQYQRAIAR